MQDADSIAARLLDACAQWVNSQGFQRRTTTLAPMWQRLHGTPLEELTCLFAVRTAKKRGTKKWVRRSAGVAFSTPFFDPPCDALAPSPPSRQRRLGDPVQAPASLPQRTGRNASGSIALHHR